MKSKLFTNFATCQNFLDFSEQIVRHDNSAVHVQGSNPPCESSSMQIALYDGQNVRCPSASDCSVTLQKQDY